MTNINEMNKIELFNKTVATLDDAIKFADNMSKYNLKKSLTLDERYNKRDTLLCYSGNTNNGTLFAIWSRIGSKRKQADYGIRISVDLYNKLVAKSNAIKILFGDMQYEDSNEYRISFTSLASIETFLNSLHEYLNAVAQKNKTKEIATQKEVIA